MTKAILTTDLPPRGKYARVWVAIKKEFHRSPDDPKWYPVAPGKNQSLQDLAARLINLNWKRARAKRPTSVGDIETYRDADANLVYVRVRPQ